MVFKISFRDIKTGKTFELNVECTDTTEDVKRRILHQECIGVEQQRLIFKGKTLQEY